LALASHVVVCVCVHRWDARGWKAGLGPGDPLPSLPYTCFTRSPEAPEAVRGPPLPEAPSQPSVPDMVVRGELQEHRQGGSGEVGDVGSGDVDIGTAGSNSDGKDWAKSDGEDNPEELFLIGPVICPCGARSFQINGV
jgi:hypothetical protein